MLNLSSKLEHDNSFDSRLAEYHYWLDADLPQLLCGVITPPEINEAINDFNSGPRRQLIESLKPEMTTPTEDAKCQLAILASSLRKVLQYFIEEILEEAKRGRGWTAGKPGSLDGR
jgi:hypothetical protein